MSLSARSRERLKGVHPDLVAVVERAAEMGPAFIVTEGLRTVDRQRQLVAAGASRTMDSRHLNGHAVDLAALVDGKVRWDWPLYHSLASIMKQAAFKQNVAIVWGGDWKSFPDGPHFELSRSAYP
jgi:peptidoglycan L-alanyl-D-glutamate endopeptidase CwlK